jgi:hypothetical protein
MEALIKQILLNKAAEATKESFPNAKKNRGTYDGMSNLVKTIKTKDNHKMINLTEEQVIDWAKKNEINSLILNNIQGCNGKILNQLFFIQKDAPEFFYTSITKQENISIKEVAIFTYKLKELFDDLNAQSENET